MKKLTLISFLLIFTFVQADTSEKNLEIIQSFQEVLEVPSLEISTPTVVEINLPSPEDIAHFGVYSVLDDVFEPYSYIRPSRQNLDQLPAQIKTSTGNSPELNDRNHTTFEDFDLDENGNGNVEIEYSFSEEIRSNSVTLSLAQYVALPNSVTLSAFVDGRYKRVLSDFRPSSRALTFPETTSAQWKIEFTFSQPLRINELHINNLDLAETPSKLRFLAQPEKTYKIYLNPDIIISQSTSEKPNLSDDSVEKTLALLNPTPNLSFELSDKDQDTIPDIYDNCVSTSNTNQEDINRNNRGDVCDDFDRDGVLNPRDNCVNDPNRNQADTDGDGIGDTCDEEESRFTERNPAIVWGGMILAVMIFLGLFASVASKIRFRKEDSEGRKSSEVPEE